MKKDLQNRAGYYWTLLARTFKAWDSDHGPRMGAALAYYALFSLAPLLIIALTVAGSFFGDTSAQDEVFKQVRAHVGTQGAQAVRDLMGSMASFKSGFLGAAASAAVLLFAASGLVSELQSGLNDIWRVEPPPRPWLALLRRRALALGFVLGSGFLLPLVWWLVLPPSNDRDWEPDVAKLPYAEVKAGSVTLRNIRDCDYRAEKDYTVRHYDRTFDLGSLRSLDLFFVDWGLPHIAHTMLSFGFGGGNTSAFPSRRGRKKGKNTLRSGGSSNSMS